MGGYQVGRPARTDDGSGRRLRTFGLGPKPKHRHRFRFPRVCVKETATSSPIERTLHAAFQTPERRIAARLAGARRLAPCRGLVPRQVRRHARALRGEPRGARAGLAEEHGQGLGDGRIRHAAARHGRAHAPRGRQRQAVRPHAGDPAPDRPLASRRRQPAGAGRAPDHGGLRRDPGRRRHAHGRHHRRLRRPLRLPRLDGDARHGEARRRPEGPRGGRLLRHPPGPAGARPRLSRGFGGRHRRQLRHDRARRHRRDPGHGRGEPFSRAELDALLGLAEGGIRQLVEQQKAVLGA